MSRKPTESLIKPKVIKIEEIKGEVNLSRFRSTSQKDYPSNPVQANQSTEDRSVYFKKGNYYQTVTMNQNDDICSQSQKIYAKKEQCCQIKILKVLRGQGQRLILRPNGNVVLQKQDKGAIFEIKMFINAQNYISIPPGDFENKGSLILEGQINSETFLPQNLCAITQGKRVFKAIFRNGLASSKNTYLEIPDEGTQFCQYEHGQKHGNYCFISNNGTETTGQYGNNMKQGTFEIRKDGQIISSCNYMNDVVVSKSSSNISHATRYLFTHKDYSINNWGYDGLNDGNWLNQLTVDYYIQLLHDYFSVVNKKKILLITTIQCQDIFSSQITQVQEHNFQITEEIEQNLKRVDQYDRVIFVMNVDRCHFIVLVYQTNNLYMLNSLPSNQDIQILDKVSKIFKSKPKLHPLTVAEQQNGYDCGVHSIYNIMLQYKFIEKHVSMIDYKVTKYQITKLRNHIKNVIIGDYAHLYK